MKRHAADEIDYSFPIPTEHMFTRYGDMTLKCLLPTISAYQLGQGLEGNRLASQWIRDKCVWMHLFARDFPRVFGMAHKVGKPSQMRNHYCNVLNTHSIHKRRSHTYWKRYYEYMTLRIANIQQPNAYRTGFQYHRLESVTRTALKFLQDRGHLKDMVVNSSDDYEITAVHPPDDCVEYGVICYIVIKFNNPEQVYANLRVFLFDYSALKTAYKKPFLVQPVFPKHRIIDKNTPFLVPGTSFAANIKNDRISVFIPSIISIRLHS